MPWFTLTGPIGGDARLAGKWKGLGGKGCGFGWVPGRASIHRGPAPFRGISLPLHFLSTQTCAHRALLKGFS